MIVHKSLFGAGRLGARRRSAPTARLGACSYTCRARGAQALRCYKPPHGGKTTRGRAFVVGIGHPRRELSPGRWYRACRGAIYEVVARCTPTLCSRRRKVDAFLIPRKFRQTYDARKRVARLKNVQLIFAKLILRNFVSDRAEVQFATSEEMGIYPSWCWRVFSDGRAHTRVQGRCLLLEDGAARNWSPAASGAGVDFILPRSRPQAHTCTRMGKLFGKTKVAGDRKRRCL